MTKANLLKRAAVVSLSLAVLMLPIATVFAQSKKVEGLIQGRSGPTDRADSVTNILIQQSKVPLTGLLAPGAMGESEQVCSDKTERGQAQNWRVVVRVVQNKAISGVQGG
jgi:hypothetical protein